MELTFVVTSRCNASCAHCATSCGPTRSDALPSPEIKRMIDEAALVKDGRPLRVDFTGGELFLDFDLLLDLVSHAAALGAEVGCVSNGYWATSEDAAMDRVNRLKAAGLHTIAISTSRFHQAFVSLRRVKRAISAARAVGLWTELKVVVTADEDGDQGAAMEWINQIDSHLAHYAPLLPYLREGEQLCEQDYLGDEGLPACACPGHSLCIAEDGVAYTCGIAGSGTPFLALGDTKMLPIASLDRLMRRAGKQHLLLTQGPIHFARAVIAAGQGDRLRKRYSSVCDLCLHIAHDPEM